MGDYLVSYPKRIDLMKGKSKIIKSEELNNDPLYIVVKVSVDDIINILKKEGFHRVRLCENKKPSQLGDGFTKMLTRTWEMHVRLFEAKHGLIAIHAEVEISRRYIQHLISERAPIIYEVINIFKRHGIDYKIWSTKLGGYVSHIREDRILKLKGKPIPMPWIPLSITLASLGLWGLLRILALVPLWPFY